MGGWGRGGNVQAGKAGTGQITKGLFAILSGLDSTFSIIKWNRKAIPFGNMEKDHRKKGDPLETLLLFQTEK